MDYGIWNMDYGVWSVDYGIWRCIIFFLLSYLAVCFRPRPALPYSTTSLFWQLKRLFPAFSVLYCTSVASKEVFWHVTATIEMARERGQDSRRSRAVIAGTRMCCHERKS